MSGGELEVKREFRFSARRVAAASERLSRAVGRKGGKERERG